MVLESSLHAVTFDVSPSNELWMPSANISFKGLSSGGWRQQGAEEQNPV